MTINWKIHCRSDINEVFYFLDTDEGRSKFWAESARRQGDSIHFIFPNGEQYISAVKEVKPPFLFTIDYFNSSVSFILSRALEGGTDVELVNTGVVANNFAIIQAGWVSVLLTLKAAVDHKIDLRNHNSQKSWDNLYADN